MAIIIGADGGKLGGPLKALEAAGEALATNHQLQTQARQEERQNMLDTASLAQQKQIMRLRDADEVRRNQEMTLRQAEDQRQQADADYTAKMRATQENERVAAKTGAASRLKAFLGTDMHNDPSFLDNGMTAEEKRAVKLGIPIETLREYDVLAENAANMSPEEYQRAVMDISARSKPLVMERRKANVVGLLQTLSSPGASADGTEEDAVIDKKRARDLQEALDNGASPDEVERVLMNTLRSHAQRQAATHVNLVRTQGLGEYLNQIMTAGSDPQLGGEQYVDPETIADAFSIYKSMEKLAPFSTPSEIAAMERDARRTIATGRSRSSGSSNKGKDTPSWYNKPNNQLTRDEAWNKALDEAERAKLTGPAFFQYGKDALALYDQEHGSAGGAPASGGAAAPTPQGQSPAAGTPAQQPEAAPQAPKIDPFSKAGTPAERVQSAFDLLSSERQAGEMFTEDEAKGLLRAAMNGDPRPERATNRNGTSRTNGQVVPLFKGASQGDMLNEVARQDTQLMKRNPGEAALRDAEIKAGRMFSEEEAAAFLRDYKKNKKNPSDQ